MDNYPFSRNHSMEFEIAIPAPKRVISKPGVEIRDSKIPQGGHGVFVCDEVRKGNLIFKISKPLLHIAPDTKKDEDNKDVTTTSNRKNTCDNCFATTHANTTSLRINLHPCPACGVLYYCSPECESAAWKDHHYFECNLLSRIINDPLTVARKWVESWFIRALFRLFCKIEAGAMSKEEEREWLTLDVVSCNMDDDETFGGQDQLIDIMKYFKMGQVNFAKARYFFNKFQNNHMADHRVLLRPCSATKNRQPTTILAAIFIDPFSSQINHSCEPNAYWYFVGPELHLRAITDISDGAELLVSYIELAGDYMARKVALKKNWDFECSCFLCEGEHPGPLGDPALQGKIVNWIQQVKLSPSGLLPSTASHDLFHSILAAGYMVSEEPVRKILQYLYHSYLQEEQNAKALKTVLRQYYFSEYKREPELFPGERIDTLKALIGTITLAAGEQHLSALESQKLRVLIPYLRSKLVKDTELCFGTDSEPAKYEKRVNLGLTGVNHGTETHRIHFIMNLNWLLLGFGLDRLSKARVWAEMRWPL